VSRFFALFVVVFVLSCNVNELEFDNIQRPNVTGSFAAPIGNISYNLRDLLIDGSDSTLDFTEDSTGLIYFIFSDTTTFNQGADIITVSNIENSTTINLDTTLVNTTTSNILISGEKDLSFEFQSDNGDLLDSVYYQSGELTIDVSTNIPNFEYSLTIFNTVDLATNQPVVVSSSTSPSVDLANHKMYLKDSLIRETLTNFFDFRLDYTIDLPPGGVIAKDSVIAISIGYLNQEFEVIFGVFGNDTLNLGENTIDIDFFSELGDKGFIFQAPVITMDFSNSYGVPMGLLFNSIYGIKKNKTVNLEGPITRTPQLINSPSLIEVGSFAESRIVIDNTNSTLPDLLEIAPTQIGLDLDAVMNPKDAEAGNFIQNTSEISVVTTISVPMILQLKELTRREEFDLGDGLQFAEADSVSIRVVSVNEIPFNVLLDIQLLDDLDSVLYENKFNRIVETAFLNTDGSLDQERKRIEDINISEEGIDALKVATKMVAIFTFSTPESQTAENVWVRFLADAEINITLAAVVTLSPEF
jgi:hypothetical protein